MDKGGAKTIIPSISLRTVESIAKKTIVKKGYGKVRLTQDNIDYVMQNILKSYVRYDPNRGTKLYSFLIGSAQYAVLRILEGRLNKKKKKQTLSLDNVVGRHGTKVVFGWQILEDEKQRPSPLVVEEIKDFISNSKQFTDNQKRILTGYFFENEPPQDLAKELNVRPSYIYALIKGGVEKLKLRFNEKYGEN